MGEIQAMINTAICDECQGGVTMGSFLSIILKLKQF